MTRPEYKFREETPIPTDLPDDRERQALMRRNIAISQFNHWQLEGFTNARREKARAWIIYAQQLGPDHSFYQRPLAEMLEHVENYQPPKDDDQAAEGSAP